jgi:hypothetical protein|nr:MAG TPA: hypothetical protein [Caudoviricetes sp.]
MRTGKTHLALKQTTRLKIRIKYWFEYLFGIKSPSREFAKLLEGDEYSEKEFRKIYIRSAEELALKKLNKAMEKTSWKKV